MKNRSEEAGALLPGRLRDAIFSGLHRAYVHAKIDSGDYLKRLRRAHRLPIQSFTDMYFMPPQILDNIADQTIAASTRLAVLEGAGLGVGGLLTVVPDMAILSTIVMRLLQKLSLLYGFEYATDEEMAALWLAAASAAGLDLGRDFIERQALERLVPRIIERIAVKVSAEVVEKWSGRLIPVLSGAIAAGLNYYFVREWGRRAKRHFREKHLAVRQSMQSGGTRALPASR